MDNMDFLLKFWGQHEYILRFSSENDTYPLEWHDHDTNVGETLITPSTLTYQFRQVVGLYVFDGVCQYLGVRYSRHHGPCRVSIPWKKNEHEGPDPCGFRQNLVSIRRQIAQRAKFLRYDDNTRSWTLPNENVPCLKRLNSSQERTEKVTNRNQYTFHSSSPGNSIFATQLIPAGTCLPYIGDQMDANETTDTHSISVELPLWPPSTGHYKEWITELIAMDGVNYKIPTHGSDQLSCVQCDIDVIPANRNDPLYYGCIINEKSEDPLHHIYNSGLVLFRRKQDREKKRKTPALTTEECLLLRQHLHQYAEYLELLFNAERTIPFRVLQNNDHYASEKGFLGTEYQERTFRKDHNFDTVESFLNECQLMWTERFPNHPNALGREEIVRNQGRPRRKTWSDIYRDMLPNTAMVVTNAEMWGADPNTYGNRTFSGKPLLYFVTLRDIQPNEELCTCYGYGTLAERVNQFGDDTWKCTNTCYFENGGIGPMWWKNQAAKFAKTLFTDNLVT